MKRRSTRPRRISACRSASSPPPSSTRSATACNPSDHRRGRNRHARRRRSRRAEGRHAARAASANRSAPPAPSAARRAHRSAARSAARPGLLHVVGIGPGDKAQPLRLGRRRARCEPPTGSATTSISISSPTSASRQQEHRFPLGDEEARVRHALELAATAKPSRSSAPAMRRSTPWPRSSTSCSTPIGDRAVSDAARRVAVEIHPGISAFQAASAAAGALIGHDFCLHLAERPAHPADDHPQAPRSSRRGRFRHRALQPALGNAAPT